MRPQENVTPDRILAQLKFPFPYGRGIKTVASVPAIEYLYPDRGGSPPPLNPRLADVCSRVTALLLVEQGDIHRPTSYYDGPWTLPTSKI